MSAPVIVVPSEDGPYFLIFQAPEGMSTDRAEEIVSNALDKMYLDESVDDVVAWLINTLAGSNIHEADWQFSRGSF